MFQQLRRFAVVGLVLLPLAGGCNQSTAPSSAPSAAVDGPNGGKPQSLPTVSLKIGNKDFTIETAVTDESREIGLMYRDSMADDHGMIFVFPDEQPRAFWMKNTHIPLDIIYADSKGKVVSVSNMKPFDLTSIESAGPAKFAIELNPGIPASTGLKVGDVISIPAPLVESAK